MCEVGCLPQSVLNVVVCISACSFDSELLFVVSWCPSFFPPFLVLQFKTSISISICNPECRSRQSKRCMYRILKSYLWSCQAGVEMAPSGGQVQDLVSLAWPVWSVFLLFRLLSTRCSPQASQLYLLSRLANLCVRHRQREGFKWLWPFSASSVSAVKMGLEQLLWELLPWGIESVKY